MMENVRSKHSPFRSLDFFTSADAAVFSGREEEIEEVATRIVAGSTLVLYGPSGVGKTSLLCAGVVPALENRRGYRVTYVRPLLSPRGDVWKAVGADPDEPLADALARMPALPSPDATPPDGTLLTSSLTLSDPAIIVLHDLAPFLRPAASAPHVLILDQLEELFTRFDESQRRPLWDGLVEVLENPSAPVRLVLSLREEYLHLLDSAHPHLPNLLDRRFRLRGLAPFGARTAIVRPLVAARIRYEPELVDRCVADLTEVPVGHSDENGVVDPLLLQIVSSEVYREAEQRDPDAPYMTLAGYAELGGPAGVFRRHLDELFNRVSTGDHLLLKLVLQEMTTAHATKLPTTVSRLSQAGLLAPVSELQRLLDKLVSANLVRKYDAEQEPWYELVHDRLVHALPEHFSGDQQFLRLRYMRELVSQLSKGFSDGMVGAPVLNRQQLAELVEPFRKYIRFSEQELNLLFRSAVANEHNVVVWRDALEEAVPGQPRAVLLDMLSQPDVRCGALASVGILRITNPVHRARCLDIALFDNDLAAVGVASRVLSVVAGAEEAARVVAALKHRQLRARALWLLAELTENPAIRAQVPRPALQFAEREHDRRDLLQSWEIIQQGSWGGLRTGLTTALLTSLSTLLFWCLSMTWLGDDHAGTYVAGGILIPVASITLSAICGYATGRATARVQAVNRGPAWIPALQELGTLGSLTIALALGAFGITSSLVGASDSLAISEQDSILVSILLCAIEPVAISASVGLIEWTLPAGYWHRTRTPIVVAIRAFFLSWSFAMIVGFLLACISGNTFQQTDLILAGTTLFGGWCSMCATPIASAFAESIWRRSQSRQLSMRRWLSHVPMAAFLSMSTLLLLKTPLPPWAPTVKITPDEITIAALKRPYHLPGSWTRGRWTKIANPSSDARIVSTNSTTSGVGSQDLLLVWPGIHAQWFTSDIERLYPLRQIDLTQEAPSPCTYTVVQLQRRDQSSWTKRIDLSQANKQIETHEIRCQVTFEDKSVAHYTKYGSRTSAQIEELAGSVFRSDESGAYIVDLGCNLNLQHAMIRRVDMVVLFESPGGRCSW